MDKIVYNIVKDIANHVLWNISNMEKENVNRMMVMWIKFMVFIICFGIIMDLINRFIEIIIYALFLAIPILFLYHNPIYGIPVTILFVLYLIGAVQDRKKRLAK